MEYNLVKKQAFTAHYRFAEDLVKEVIEMRTVDADCFLKIELGKTFITDARVIKIKEFFSKECHRLDEHIRKYTSRDESSDFSDQQFSRCVAQFIEKYKLEHESEDELILVCFEIAYTTAHFLSGNKQSDAINVAVNRVYEMLIDTFHPSILTEGRPVIKAVCYRKYRLAYTLIKTLVKLSGTLAELSGILVPQWEQPNLDNLTFTANHREKIITLIAQEWTVLDEIAKSFIFREGIFDYGDENLSRCMDEVVKEYGFQLHEDDGLLLVSARVAYTAAAFLKGNRRNMMDLAVDRIQQFVNSTIHCKKYKQDEDYRFSCDLVKEIVEMRSNPLSVAEMSDSGNSFFMLTHRNKIEELLSREKSKLDEVVREFISKDESSGYDDNQFLLCIDQIIDDYRPEYTTTEEMVLACVRIAYVAACFSRKRSKSNAPELAVDRMLEIIKDINCFTNSKEEVLIMHTQDSHYRFAYGLVKAVLEMKKVQLSDVYLPNPCNLHLTATQRKKIENLFLKKKSLLDKLVENLTSKFGVLDYSDGNFLQCMFQIIRDYQCGQITEKRMVYFCVSIAYTCACFLKKNIISNAAFLAVNRIYEIVKDANQFSNSVVHQDEHYRFAYDLTQTVLEIKKILRSPLYLPDTENCLFTDTHRSKIRKLLLKERVELDKMVENLTGGSGSLDCSDNKFLQCMDQIVQEYKSDQNTEEGFVYVCARIAYTAAVFYENNFRSHATFLAVNRMYEMSKDSYHFTKRMEEAWVKHEDYQLAYDLVKATFEIRSKPSFQEETLHIDDSDITIPQRTEIQHFLSKEWPRLHGLVRRFTGRQDNLEFSDDQFLECMHQLISDYESEQKSEGALIQVLSRIAYVATCFLRKNQSSNATQLAVNSIYEMRKKFFRFRNRINPEQTSIRNSIEEKTLIVVDFRDDKYRFAYDLVGTVMELQNTPLPDEELPDPQNFLFTPQHRSKIKKFFLKQSTKIEQKVEKLTIRDGNLDYSDSNFLHCMDIIFKDDEDKQATKDGFVRLCASIAYPVSYFEKRNNNSNARTLAVERIHDMVKNSIHFNKDLEDRVEVKS